MRYYVRICMHFLRIYGTCWLHLAINVPKCNTVYSVLQYSSVIHISTRHGGVWCLVPINAILHGISIHLLPRPSTEGDVKPHVRRRCGAGRQGVSNVWSKAWLKNASHGDFLDENLWGIISFPFTVIFVFLLVFLLVDVQSSGETFGKLC